MKEKNKNQGGKLKWSKKVQIKFVINLSVPDIPSAQEGDCRAEDGFPLFVEEQ